MKFWNRSPRASRTVRIPWATLETGPPGLRTFAFHPHFSITRTSSPNCFLAIGHTSRLGSARASRGMYTSTVFAMACSFRTRRGALVPPRPWTAASQLLQPFSPAVHVVLGAHVRLEGDLLRDLLAREDVERHVDRLAAAGRVLEARRQDALFHVGLALVRKGVNPDEQHLLLAPGGLGGQIGAVSARIVVAVDQVDLGMGGERGLHLLARVRLEPLHVGVEHYLEVGALDPVAEARVTVLPRRRRHEALELDEVALAAQLFDHPLASGAPDLLVSAPMKLV